MNWTRIASTPLVGERQFAAGMLRAKAITRFLPLGAGADGVNPKFAFACLVARLRARSLSGSFSFPFA